jgi:UPF0755 protein
MPSLRNIRLLVKTLAILVAAGLFILAIGAGAPSDFPDRQIISIEKNTGLTHNAKLLARNNIIRSQFWYKVFVVLFGGHRNIKVGDYLFDEPQSAIRVAYRTVHGVYGLPKIKVTLPEGTTAEEMAWILLKNIPGFNAPAFTSIATEHEGYLFPDTYFFYEGIDPDTVLDTLRSTFDEKIAPLQEEIKKSGHSLKEVITMASIVEREAATSTDRRIIAGILWKRMEIKMPLQIDAAFYYLLGKGSSQLTLDDLKLDSPYNTYTQLGLPPTPIANPGLAAIRDTLNPTESKYFYYLSDEHGITHYAETFEDHVENKRKHL